MRSKQNLHFLWAFSFLLSLYYTADSFYFLPRQWQSLLPFSGQAKAIAFAGSCFFLASFFVFFLNSLCWFIAKPGVIEQIPRSILPLPWKNYWFASDYRKEKALRNLSKVAHNIALYGNFLYLVFLYLLLRYPWENLGQLLFNRWTMIMLIISVFFWQGILVRFRPPIRL